jgi:hypothetical protein
VFRGALATTPVPSSVPARRWLHPTASMPCTGALPRPANGVPDFVAELISFPGKNDDQVDAVACIFQALDKIAPGRAPTPKEEQKRLVIGGPGTNICMEDLWAEEERRVSKFRSSRRI